MKEKSNSHRCLSERAENALIVNESYDVPFNALLNSMLVEIMWQE
jgi:hypothetical protein